MTIKHCLLIAASLCASTFAHAETCNNPQTQMKMNECAGKALDQATQKINEQYKNIRSHLDEAGQLHLKNLQLQWIKSAPVKLPNMKGARSKQ
ncbi:hypothetical protein DTO96_101448 [Ephemeroptericola cinctiostellae]|uniref:Lysozyme inhibitor LprI-like N-terminal domain-containing protein n=1 Tax=Ephemeroptericola cinctiostellae TaxID=2268024 RepID=A0A345DBH7_9BURK|nr:lysozyme inhibitor LprI family protein [Ephemeroptericola cinctiostellae]AXF85715.1 hypothetical protein DTO96_101448 [Ephemeroptericola cinctiostellae]